MRLCCSGLSYSTVKTISKQRWTLVFQFLEEMLLHLSSVELKWRNISHHRDSWFSIYPDSSTNCPWENPDIRDLSDCSVSCAVKFKIKSIWKITGAQNTWWNYTQTQLSPLSKQQSRRKTEVLPWSNRFLRAAPYAVTPVVWQHFICK